MDETTNENVRLRADLLRAVRERDRLVACLDDIRRSCGNRTGYLGWVARRIDAENGSDEPAHAS